MYIPQTCTELETVSLTAKLTQQTHNWHRHSKVGSLGARAIGVIATPLTCLIDTLVHTFLFVGKGTAGLFVSFYNHCIARHIDRKYMINRDLEFSSALVHLARIVDNASRVAILPVLMLCSPERGYQISQESSGELLHSMKSQMISDEQEITKLAKGVVDLKAKLQEEKQTQEKLLAEYKPILEAMQEEIDQLELKKDELLDENGKFTSQIAQLEQKIAQLEETLTQKKQSLQEALSGTVSDASLLEERDQLAAKLEEALLAIKGAEQAKGEAEKSLQQQASALEKLHARIEELEVERFALNDTIAQAKDRVSIQQGKVAQLTGQVEKASAESAALRLQLDEQTQLASELKAKVEEQQTVMTMQKEELDSLLQYNKQLETAALAHESQMSEMASKDASIEALKGQLQSSIQAVNSSADQLEAQTKKIEQLESERESLQQKIEAYEHPKVDPQELAKGLQNALEAASTGTAPSPYKVGRTPKNTPVSHPKPGESEQKDDSRKAGAGSLITDPSGE